MNQKIKLSEWSRLNHYSYQGAYNLCKRGGIPGSTQDSVTGTILIELPPHPGKPEYNVVYDIHI